MSEIQSKAQVAISFFYLEKRENGSVSPPNPPGHISYPPENEPQFVSQFNIPNIFPPTLDSRKLDSAGNPSICAALVDVLTTWNMVSPAS